MRRVLAAGLLLLVMAVPAVAFKNYTIPSGNMMPALFIGDRFTVAFYGIDYDALAAGKTLEEAQSADPKFEPQLGDIATFRLPSGADYVKRIVGLPGDRVQMKAGRLWRNGAKVDAKPVSHLQDDIFDGQSYRFVRETLPNSITYITLDLAEKSAGDNTKEFTVPAGHYFVLGDNRDNSLDSRFLEEFHALSPFIPRSAMVGRLNGIWPNAAHAPGAERMAGYPDLR